jgi:hypothetical protein
MTALESKADRVIIIPINTQMSGSSSVMVIFSIMRVNAHPNMYNIENCYKVVPSVLSISLKIKKLSHLRLIKIITILVRQTEIISQNDDMRLKIKDTKQQSSKNYYQNSVECVFKKKFSILQIYK